MKRMEMPMIRNISTPVKKAAAREAAIPQSRPWASTPPQPEAQKKADAGFDGQQPYVRSAGIRIKVQIMFPSPNRDRRNRSAPTPVATTAMIKKME